MPVDLAYPFTGRWLVQMSPANRVPSHGTTLFATAYAIDFLPVDDDGRTAPLTVTSLLRSESPQAFAGFGREILSPVAGTVITSHDGEADHDAYRGLPSIGYALSQRRRARAGWPGLAANHVMIHAGDVVVSLCHLRRGSLRVRAGDHVEAGDAIALCGNSGNSTEPHVHVQATDGPLVDEAAALPLSFHGALPRNGDVVAA